MLTALITGVNGFIGSRLAGLLLEKDFQVIGVGRRSATVIQSNKCYSYIDSGVENISISLLNNVDYLFHLSFETSIPQTIADPVDTCKKNIFDTVRLFNVAKEASLKKVVFASTASIYGRNKIPWTEGMGADPLEPYSWQKLTCEDAARLWAKQYGLPVTSLRLFQVYGEKQRSDTAIALFARQKRVGSALTVTNAGSDDEPISLGRDFIYIGDVVNAFYNAAISPDTGSGEVINIGSGRMIQVVDVARAIGEEIKWIPKRAYETDFQLANIERAQKVLGWRPSVNLLDWLSECKWPEI